MKKQWKKILYGLMLMAFATAGYGFYLFNKKPADVRTLPDKYELTAYTLMNDFNKDETAANKKYLDKVIAVQGKVSDVKLEPSTGQATVILDSGDPMAAITCSFYDDEAGSLKEIKQGQEIVVKGKCTGKLMDVILNKCSIEK
jgi:hypothetical protein